MPQRWSIRYVFSGLQLDIRDLSNLLLRKTMYTEIIIANIISQIITIVKTYDNVTSLRLSSKHSVSVAYIRLATSAKISRLALSQKRSFLRAPAFSNQCAGKPTFGLSNPTLVSALAKSPDSPRVLRDGAALTSAPASPPSRSSATSPSRLSGSRPGIGSCAAL